LKNFKFKVLGNSLPYDDLNSLRVRLAEISPTLIRYDSLEPANFVSENLELLKVLRKMKYFYLDLNYFF
jgi:hypothetical protein